jgi:hypothetical protein
VFKLIAGWMRSTLVARHSRVVQRGFRGLQRHAATGQRRQVAAR